MTVLKQGLCLKSGIMIPLLMDPASSKDIEKVTKQSINILKIFQINISMDVKH
jgi:hypothetical protein